MECFFAQNLTLVEKSKPTNQPKRGAEKPSMFRQKDPKQASTTVPTREFSSQNPPIFSTVKLPFVKQVWEMDKETQAVGIACPVNQHCVVRFFRSKFGRL